jgi:secreted PhoX family phosphatase
MGTTHTGEALARRSFLKRSAGVAAGLAVAGRFEALGGRAASAESVGGSGALPAGAAGAAAAGYGPLVPVKDQATGLELLLLPEGFEYISYGWTGDVMDDGRPTPGAHDGMAAFRLPDGTVRLVRNHERGAGPAFATGMTYDPSGGGGTTTLAFDPDGESFLGSHASLAGTLRNCAGGPTPWGRRTTAPSPG